MVDAGVHSGPRRAVEWLQTALGVSADGVLGPRTRAALMSADPVALYRRVLAARLRFLGRQITQDRRQAAFAAGWMAPPGGVGGDGAMALLAALAPGLIEAGGRLLDRLIPDPTEREQAKRLLFQAEGQALAELQVSISAILVEADVADPWTSRARPTFLYAVILLCILGKILVIW